tara:strand:- start:111 stop:794 length:684 start_codon:yes stop_codon:yes gene_type:complete
MTHLSIKNHPSYDMLLNHAMGKTSEAESLIISCHLAYCKDCKAEMDKYEKIGGYYLHNHEQLKVSKNLWEDILRKVDGVEQVQKQNSYISYNIESNLTEKEINIPSFLSEYLGGKGNTNQWKSTINNVRYIDIDFENKKLKGKLLEIPAGKSMPKHGHEAHEATLVLHGGYSDEKGSYNKGDLVVADSEEVHSPVSSDVTGCICLVVYSGSLKFKGILGSLLNLSKF